MADFFNYDWNAPFRSAAYRQPAPRRLTLEELLAQEEEFKPAPRPDPVRSVRDLDPEARRAARQQSLWAGMASMGASMSSGDWRHAGNGVSQVQDIEAQALGQANQQREETWARDQQAKAAEIAAGQERQKKAALFGVYEKIAAAEPPGSSLVTRAETAAKAGSMAELQGLLNEIPKRQAARAKGYDPDAWETSERLQAELKAEIERKEKAEAWRGELQRLKEKEQAEADAELAAREAQNRAGVLFQPRETPAEAAAKAEAVARVQAKYRERSEAGGVKGSLYKQGEQVVFAQPPSAEHPRGLVTPLDGQPETIGNLTYFSIGNKRFVQDKRDPTATAYESPIVREGEPGWENRPGTQKDRPPAAPQANHVLNATVEDLASGALTEAEALEEIRRAAPSGKINGYLPEQILAEAKGKQMRWSKAQIIAETRRLLAAKRGR
jgi:hypothetical protein